MIERIVHAGRELALILRHSFRGDGIQFLTGDDAPLQLGYMSRPAGYVIAPHVHRPVPRQVSFTQEVLLLRSGRVRVDFYDDDQCFLQSAELRAGDVVLLALGGHGFEMLEPSELIEVKQGPYVGEQDKIRFAPASEASRRGEPS